MVAYSFQERFIQPIEAGTKRQTIRAHGKKRHARPGEELQLYYAQRSPACRLIGVATCAATFDVRLDLKAGRVDNLRTGSVAKTRTDLDAFAVGDGFSGWDDLTAFWAKEHPGADVFEGLLIVWKDRRLPGVG